MGLLIENIDQNNIDREKIHKAAKVVEEGGLVAFPTETVYGIACRAKSDSLAKLNKIKNRDESKYYSLHIPEDTDLNRFVPRINPRASRLVRKLWPGPLTLVFELENQDMVKVRKNLGYEIYQNLYKNHSIGIRCPNNPVAQALFSQIVYPAVAPSANESGTPPATNPEQVKKNLGDKIDLLLAAGPCKYNRSSTVAKVNRSGINILREGVYSREKLKAESAYQVLLVCTGNTCRSPMGESIFRKYLSEKLGCRVDELSEKGYKVCSAGISGIAGMPVSTEAVEACRKKGIKVGPHTSKPLSQELINESDLIFVMTRSHREKVLSLNPKASDRCRLLAHPNDIPDPIGQDQQVYNRCADAIESAIKRIIDRMYL